MKTLFSINKAADLLEKDRATLVRALRHVEPDGHERDQPRYVDRLMRQDARHSGEDRDRGERGMIDTVTDDKKALAADLDRLAADAASLATRVRQLGRIGDALDDLRNGGLLTTSQAATICEVTDQAIRDWIEHSIKIGRPIAEKRATWIVSTPRLLAFVERRDGFPARVKAENRFGEHWPKWSQAPELRTGARERAAG